MTQTQLQHTQVSSLHNDIIKLCHELEIPLHFNHHGPKIYTNYQRIALIILHLRSKWNLRDFVSRLHETKWVSWLGLKEIPSKSVLNDWMHLFKLSSIRKLNTMLLRGEKPRLMAVDATGFDSWQRSRHYEKRIGAAPMPYAKVDFLVDTETKLVHDFVLRVKPRHDVLGATTMIKRFKQENVLILADKGYDSEKLHELVAESGNEFYAPVRDFNVKRPKGYHRRKCIQEHKQYNQRNLVESTIRSLKVRIRNLRNKQHWMKKRELGWHILTYNLEKLEQATKKLLALLLRNSILDRAQYC